MPRCAKCDQEVKKTHSCDHTDNEAFCVGCYTELHYYMTESK